MGLALAQRQRRQVIGPRAPLTPILLSGQYNFSLFGRCSLSIHYNIKTRFQAPYLPLGIFTALVGRICCYIG